MKHIKIIFLIVFVAILLGSSDSLAHAASPRSLTVVASIEDGVGGFDALNGAFDITIITIDGSIYALVASARNEGLQIIDISDPSSPLAVASIADCDPDDGDTSQCEENSFDSNGNVFDQLNGARSVTTVTIDGTHYALVAASSDDGLQIIDISDPSSPLAVASITDNPFGGTGDYDVLDDAAGVATVTIGASTYALVAASNDDGITIIDISDPTTPTLITTLTNGNDGFNTLNGAYDITIETIGGSTYALVASRAANGVQIIDISNLPSDPTSIADWVFVDAVEQGGISESLAAAYNITTVTIGGSTYALVVGQGSNGVQIIDISDPSDPISVAEGVIVDDSIDPNSQFTNIESLRDITTITIGASTYAIVTAHDEGITIIDISNLPSDPTFVFSVTDSVGGFDTLHGATGITTVIIDETVYMLVTSIGLDDGVQIIDLSPVAYETLVLVDDDGDGEIEVSLLSYTTIETITIPQNVMPIISVEGFDDAIDGNIEDARAQAVLDGDIDASTRTFPAQTITIEIEDSVSIEFPPALEVLFPNGVETIIIDVNTVKTPENDADFMAAFSSYDLDSSTVFEFGNPNVDLIFSVPVKITIPGLSDSNLIFSINASNETLEISECSDTVVNSGTADTFIDTITATSLLDGEACYTGDDIWTRHFSGFGGSGILSDDGGGGGGDNAWKTKPTFGLSHTTNNPIVQCGFSWDNTCYDITDNWHTPFEKVGVTTGTYHMMTVKAYFQHPPLFIEFALVPELKAFHQSETKIEVLFEDNSNNYYNSADDDTIIIKSITVIQKDNLIDESLLSGTILETPCGYVDDDCYELSIYGIMFREVPFFEKIGIQAADTTRRTQITYLNEGFEIDGISLNPAKIVQITHHLKLGLFQVIQLDKFENLWSDEDGIIYTINKSDTWIRLTPIPFERYPDTATNVITRMHSEFYKIVDYEKKRAEEVFLEKFGVTENLDVGTFTPMNITSNSFDNIKRDSSFFEVYKQGQLLLAEHILEQIIDDDSYAQYKKLQAEITEKQNP